MQLYDDIESLAYLVNRIDTYVAFAKANPSVAKTMSKFVSKLEDLKADLVITTGDNYVNSAPNELREDMTELYGQVVGQFDKPSVNQIENHKLLKEELNDGWERLNKLEKKYAKKFNKAASKVDNANFEIIEKEAFLKK